MGNGLRHIQLFPRGTRLGLRSDHYPFGGTQRHPVVGSCLYALPAFLPFSIDKVAHAELPFAVLRGNLDMLLAATVLKTNLVGRGRADHVAGIVAVGDQVRAAAIMHNMGNKRSVRIAAFKTNGHLGPVQQRKVNTKGIASIGSAETNQGAFKAITLLIQVKIELHPVAPMRIKPGIGFISADRRNSCRHRSGYYWPGYVFRAEAVAVDMRDPR
ncbi:hypothetical protein D3C76_1270300 [compost metagenome]